MKILITGTPGTGKTSVSRELGDLLGLPVYSEKELVGPGEIDPEDLRNAVLEIDAGIFEGHVFCEIFIPFDRVFLLRTNPFVLLERLKARGYPPEKIAENVEAEAIDYVKIRLFQNGYRFCELDTTKRSPKETAKKIVGILNGTEECESIDWSPLIPELIVRLNNLLSRK